MPAHAALVFLVGDEGRQLVERLVGGGLRHRNGHVPIERHAFRLRQELFGIAVLGVRRKERKREAKRFVNRARAQKLQCVVFVLLGDVNLGAVGLLDPMSAGVGAAKVEVLGRELAIVPLADVPDVIAVRPQQAGIRLCPRCIEGLHRWIAVSGHPLPGEQARPTHPADRGGDAVLGEAKPLARQSVEVGRFHHRIARTAERVEAPVVGVEQDHVQRLVLGGWGLNPNACHEKGERQHPVHGGTIQETLETTLIPG